VSYLTRRYIVPLMVMFAGLTGFLLWAQFLAPGPLHRALTGAPVPTAGHPHVVHAQVHAHAAETAAGTRTARGALDWLLAVALLVLQVLAITVAAPSAAGVRPGLSWPLSYSCG
jgi:hypothetical protein